MKLYKILVAFSTIALLCVAPTLHARTITKAELTDANNEELQDFLKSQNTSSANADKNFELVNELRSSLGLATLRRDPLLDNAAKVRAQELESYYSHTRPNGANPFTSIAEAGYVHTYAAENIATASGYGDNVMGEKFFDMWKNSSGHYKNMVSRDYKDVGIAMFKTSGGTWYAVQLFGTSKDGNSGGGSGGGNNGGDGNNGDGGNNGGGNNRGGSGSNNGNFNPNGGSNSGGNGGGNGDNGEFDGQNDSSLPPFTVVPITPDQDEGNQSNYHAWPRNGNPVINTNNTSNPPTTGNTTTSSSGDNNVSIIYARVNELRRSVGADPLYNNSKLNNAAQVRAQELVQYYSHTRPNGTEPFTAMTEWGYNYSYAAENIAMASGHDDDAIAELFFKMWRESSGHYRNMVNHNYKEIGIGLYKSGDTWYAVQLFGSPN